MNRNNAEELIFQQWVWQNLWIKTEKYEYRAAKTNTVYSLCHTEDPDNYLDLAIGILSKAAIRTRAM